MFPSSLQPQFTEEILDASASSIAVIDARSSVLWVNRRWREVGIRHGLETAPGTPYFGGTSGPLLSLLEAAFANAFSMGAVYELEYECSSPEDRRRFHLRALPVNGEAHVLDHALVAVEPIDEESHPPLEEHYLRATATILQCSNCRRVHHSKTDAWHWVPAWVRRSHARTSHGICPGCMRFYYAQPRPHRR